MKGPGTSARKFLEGVLRRRALTGLDACLKQLMSVALAPSYKPWCEDFLALLRKKRQLIEGINACIRASSA